jgi:hypothetical protein
MKTITLLLLLCIILSGCTKDIDPVSAVDPSVFKGLWAGNIHYNITGMNEVNMSATRTISFQNSEFTSVWWVVPSCKTLMQFTGVVYSVDALLADSTICHGIIHRWTYEWKGSGELFRDTLTESGFAEYRYYVGNKLMADSFGDWDAEFTR